MSPNPEERVTRLIWNSIKTFQGSMTQPAGVWEVLDSYKIEKPGVQDVLRARKEYYESAQ